MPGVQYYDLRHVTGEVTHIDIDNGVVESAGSSFFNKAVIRVLSETGWGVLQIDNYIPCTGQKFDAILESACRLARITQETVILGDAPRGMLDVPPMKEDPRGVSIEEKSSLLSGIELSCETPFDCEQESEFHRKNRTCPVH